MTHDESQRVVLGLLLENHPAMLSLEDLRGRLADVDDVEFAVSRLADDGLASRVGHLVGASRAAVRADQLDVI
jgi:hypothetical protein